MAAWFRREFSPDMVLRTGNLFEPSIATDQDSRLSWSEHINRSAVKFAGEDDDDRDKGLEEEEVSVETAFLLWLSAKNEDSFISRQFPGNWPRNMESKGLLGSSVNDRMSLPLS